MTHRCQLLQRLGPTKDRTSARTTTSKEAQRMARRGYRASILHQMQWPGRSRFYQKQHQQHCLVTHLNTALIWVPHKQSWEHNQRSNSPTDRLCSLLRPRASRAWRVSLAAWGLGVRELSSVLARVGTPIHQGHLSEMPPMNPILPCPLQAGSSWL